MFGHGGADNANGIEEETEKIFNYIKKEKNIEIGNYVVHSIQDGVPNNPDKPTQQMKPSTITDGTSMTEQLIHEQEITLYSDELELHQIKQKKHVDMIMIITSEMSRAYAIQWGECTQ